MLKPFLKKAIAAVACAAMAIALVPAAAFAGNLSAQAIYGQITIM